MRATEVTTERAPTQFLFLAMTVGASVTAGAVQNPELAKAETPVVLHCGIGNVGKEEAGSVSIHSATCEVLEVIRADTDVKPCDVVTIAYQVEHEKFDSSEQPPDPGPAFPTPPPALVAGQTVLAYLRAAVDGDGKTVYSPNIGRDSFEEPPEAPVSGDSRCRDAGPTMSHEKVCGGDLPSESVASSPRA
jgi:hypothetical protein